MCTLPMDTSAGSNREHDRGQYTLCPQPHLRSSGDTEAKFEWMTWIPWMTWIRTPTLLPHSPLPASVSAHLPRLPGWASLVVCPSPATPPPPTLLQRHCETKHSSAPREFSWLVPQFLLHLFPSPRSPTTTSFQEDLSQWSLHPSLQLSVCFTWQHDPPLQPHPRTSHMIAYLLPACLWTRT